VGLRIFRRNSFFWDDDEKALKAALEMVPSFRLRRGTHIKVVMKTDLELL
jgi:type IV secretory pathway VirB10-like protein